MKYSKLYVRSRSRLLAVAVLTALAGFATDSEVFAQALAGRVVKEAASDQERVRLAFRLATGRNPAEDEMAVLSRVLATQRQTYAADAEEAKQMCGGKTPFGLEHKEFAAWVMVGRVVLNVDESITRE